VRVGVVGGGAMGQWLKREIGKEHDVLIYDVDKSKSDVGSLAALVEWSEVVLVAVPFWDTAKVLSDIAPMASGKLIMDIATFKEGLAEVYRQFPPDAEVATVHPLFGPGASSIKGQRVLIMEVPGRSGAQRAFDFWRSLGAEVEWGDLSKHDYYVSRTIALSYAVGLALARLYSEVGEEIIKYGGTSFKYLATYAFSLLRDKNARRYAERAPLDEFIRALREGGDFDKVLIDPNVAYERFYKALECIGDIFKRE